MIRKVVIAISAGLIVASCTGYVPREWRTESVEQQGLRWAVKLCHQIGYTVPDSEERRKCIARRYDQYLMENK